MMMMKAIFPERDISEIGEQFSQFLAKLYCTCAETAISKLPVKLLTSVSAVTLSNCAKMSNIEQSAAELLLFKYDQLWRRPPAWI